MLVTRKAWQPPTDIYETPGEVVIKMEVAGMRESGSISRFMTTCWSSGAAGPTKPPAARSAITTWVSAYGEFASDIQLARTRSISERVSADYEAGFLTVSLPKLPARSSRAVSA